MPTPAAHNPQTTTVTIPACSRRTFAMSPELYPAGALEQFTSNASTLVECKTPGEKIIVERAMYWNSRGAGTDTIGGFSD